MLKTVPTEQVRLGMFIHELKGPWMDHPFWKKAFKLVEPADLRKLQASAIREVVIDTAKGFDVEETLISTTSPQTTPDPTANITEPKAPPKPKRIGAEEEIDRAKIAISATQTAVANMFGDARKGREFDTVPILEAVNSIIESVSRNEGALISLVRLKNQDNYTYLRSVAVSALMAALAKTMEFSDEDIKRAALAGLLHDIGKALIPSEILNKPGALTDNEFAIMRSHPEKGHALLQESGITDKDILDACLHHHEKMDGTGYPHQRKGGEIGLFAKMCAICDVYDAITSNRQYKDGWERGGALQRMAKWSGQFDEAVFNAFVKMLGVYPIGSMVMLKSGRLAVVIDQSPKSLLTPVVKVFFSTKSKVRLIPEILDLSTIGIQDSIIGHENPANWGIPDIDKIWAH